MKNNLISNEEREHRRLERKLGRPVSMDEMEAAILSPHLAAVADSIDSNELAGKIIDFESKR